jgi:WD40 repeat protein
MTFSPDGRWLAAVGSGGQTIELWELTTGREVPHIAENMKYAILFVSFSPDSTVMFTGDL